MRAEDFWVFEDEPWANPVPALNIQLLDELRRRPPDLNNDTEAALLLIRLIYEELLTFGTGGTPKITDLSSRDALRTLGALLSKVGYRKFDIPFSDLAGFRSYWLMKGARGNWQARRDLLRPIFEPALFFLEELQDTLLGGEGNNVLLPITHDFRDQWVSVEAEISALRGNFAKATSPQDFRNVGNDCVAVITRLAQIVYTEEIHASYDGPMPSRDDTKERLIRFVDHRLEGSSNSSLRSLVRKVIELAQDTKHDLDGSRLRTILAADSVIMLANIIKSLDEFREINR